MSCSSHRLLVFLLFASLALQGVAGPKDEVAAATKEWTEAFASHDAGRIAALYAPDAVFWGTTSPIIRDTSALIHEYFENLKNRPHVRIELSEQHIRVYGATPSIPDATQCTTSRMASP